MILNLTWQPGEESIFPKNLWKAKLLKPIFIARKLKLAPDLYILFFFCRNWNYLKLLKGHRRRIRSGLSYLTAFYQYSGHSIQGSILLPSDHLVLPWREHYLCFHICKIKSSPCQSWYIRFVQPGQQQRLMLLIWM